MGIVFSSILLIMEIGVLYNRPLGDLQIYSSGIASLVPLIHINVAGWCKCFLFLSTGWHCSSLCISTKGTLKATVVLYTLLGHRT